MDNYGETFIAQSALKQKELFKALAKDYLKYLGNANPSKKQLAEIQTLLSNVWVKQPIQVDLRLSELEKKCLYLSAQGKGLKDIASFLDISIRRVTQYRQAIFAKLNCKNIAQAIAIGLRYGERYDPIVYTPDP